MEFRGDSWGGSRGGGNAREAGLLRVPTSFGATEQSPYWLVWGVLACGNGTALPNYSESPPMNPHRKIRVSTGMSPGMSRPVQGGLTVAALVFVPLLAVAGSDGLRATLDFTTGVLSLVSLSAAVAWGLLATDRLFLSTRQRIVCQGVHRATAVASLGFLLLHGTVKVALGHVSLIGALIPFGLGVTGTAGLIGFGALAGLLMVLTAATGALRSAFAQPSPTAARLGQSLGSPGTRAESRAGGAPCTRWRIRPGAPR